MRAQVTAGPGARAVLGFGALLFIAGNTYVVAPFADLGWLGPFDGVVRAAGVAVAIVLSGTTAELAGLMLAGASRAGVLRHVGRLLAAIWVALLLAVGLVLLSRLLDERDDGFAVSGGMVARLLGFTWNHYVADAPLAVPKDLAPLWVFSIAAQCVLALGLLWLLARGHRRLLTVAVLVAATGGTAWAWHVGHREGGFQATLDSWAMGATGLWGAGVVLLLGPVARTPRREHAARLLGWGGLVGCVVAAGWLPAEASYSGHLAVAAISTGLVVVGSETYPATGSILLTAMTRVLAVIGKRWHVMVASCTPLMMFLIRHQPSGDPVTVLLAWLLITIMAVVVPDVLVPVARDRVDAIRSRRRRRSRTTTTTRENTT